MTNYILLVLIAGLIGYGIAEIPYYLANNPTQERVRPDHPSFAEMMEAGLGYLARDERREAQG